MPESFESLRYRTGSQPAATGARLESGSGGMSVVGSSPTASAASRKCWRSNLVCVPDGSPVLMWDVWAYGRTGRYRHGMSEIRVRFPVGPLKGSCCLKIPWFSGDNPRVVTGSRWFESIRDQFSFQPGHWRGKPPSDTGVKTMWCPRRPTESAVCRVGLSSWCSPECTPPCQGGGRGFKSHRGR